MSNFTLLHDSSDIKVIRVPSGEGDKFVLTALPLEAQVSPVYVIVADDFDGTEIWISGWAVTFMHSNYRQTGMMEASEFHLKEV